ncbi:MAG: class I SAM-dependent methyltransferase [Verrucomicrobiota bacterium]|nr:class I SAM-dependent methyltransferase [Verrucomicrobiota bacterium]
MPTSGNGDSPVRALNADAFDTYYDKPRWWFFWRYDTQVKRKTCLTLVRRHRRDWHGKKILELGFGSADTLFSFPRDCHIVGIEMARSAVERAKTLAVRKGYGECHFHQGDASGPLPVGPESCDLAIASHVLEHLPDDGACLRRIHAALKPEAALVVLVPVNERFMDPKHVRPYTFESCRLACADAGFHMVWGFENERLFYLVERLYLSPNSPRHPAWATLAKVAFNVMTSCWPFWMCRVADAVLAGVWRLPPRQAALLLVKETVGAAPRQAGKL